MILTKILTEKKIIWVGDACCSSGFARVTHAICDYLHSKGHEIHVLGLNHWGDENPYPYPVYRCVQPFDGGHDRWGVERLPKLIKRINPDVVILLNDPWNIQAYLDSIAKNNPAGPHPPVIGYLAVDAKNQDGQPLNSLNHVIVWTEFAAQELKLGGYSGSNPSIVPLGVDVSTFYPKDKISCRNEIFPFLSANHSFIIGVVGRNQPRKRLDLTLDYFSTWIKDHNIPNAYLYLHVAPTGDQGCDIRKMVRYHNIQGRVIIGEPSSIGYGASNESMAKIYSCLDLYLTTTQGEGWGLPCLEAMACGVPCIVPDWSGLGDWTQDAAEKIPCTSTALNAPLNSLAYTVGGIADKQKFVHSLQDLYQSESLRNEYYQKGLDLASSLTWEITCIRFEKTLAEFFSDQSEVAA